MGVIRGAVDCLPEETGYDSSRLEVLNQHFQRLIDKEVIMGAEYSILHKGKIIANNSLGRGDFNASKPMQPDTVFGIASVTKTFTSIAIMQLIEEGYFRLDSTVSELLPQFENPPFNNIRIWHLLTHTSGLYPDGQCFSEASPKSAWELVDIASRQGQGEDTCDWIGAGISSGLRVPVGSQWQYCSFGFLILGEIISRVSGQFAEEYIMKHIVEPLGMENTGFQVSKEMASRAFIHNEQHQKYIECILEGEPIPTQGGNTIWRHIPRTGGGLVSNTRDLAQFSKMLLHKGTLEGVRILGKKSIEKMTTQQLHNIPDYCWGSNEPNRLYGLGFDMRQGPGFTYSEGSYMHEGAGSCSMDIDPKEELAAVWFVPWHKLGWSAAGLYNVQNIIWSGIK